MNFSQLLWGLGVSHSGGDPEISGLDYNSRRVEPGFVFVAMRGESSDGNRYIDAALKNCAVAVVTDSKSEPRRENVPWAVIPNGRRALSHMSANFYGHPAEKLKIIGITGTNGKTTTTFLCESILRHCAPPSALIGTIEYHVPAKAAAQAGMDVPYRVLPSPHTTPEALELNQIFAEALAAGATHAVMEVSSHTLAQERVWGVPYEVAVFTNLTRDHLDYHKSMDSYFEAKSILFLGCGTRPPRASVINADDEYGQSLGQSRKTLSQQVILYGIQNGDFRANNIELQQDGTKFDLVTPSGTIRIETALIGGVNVYNILAAAAATFACGCSLKQIAEAIREFKQVPGRFEKVDCGQPFTVVVDYAHTDDALPGLRQTGTRHEVEPDRRRAIRLALIEAMPGDVVLIAGKGHEKVQIMREGTYPFDDVQVAREALQQMSYAGGGKK